MLASSVTASFALHFGMNKGPTMSSRQSVEQVFEREFLPLRANILKIAAALDRIERSGPMDNDDPRGAQLRAGIKVLLSSEAKRAEEVQLIFSRKYHEDWKTEFKLDEK